MTTLGAVHLVFSLIAILSGAVVLLIRKGTRWHRTWGHAYLWSMVGVVVTSFTLYNMTGRVGPFHFAALVAGVTVVFGMGMVLLRRPKKDWIEGHARTMSWSYVGLMAAFMAETLSRFVMPFAMERYEGAEQLMGVFWMAVGGATFVTVGIGWWLMKSRLQRSIEATPQAMRAEREELRELEGVAGD